VEFGKKKTRLLEGLKHQGISQRVLDAMSRVPREVFLPESQRPYAYHDSPLEIGWGQTISAPHMVAIMCDLLDLREGLKVLEVGTGSGYHAAVIAELVGESGHVYTMEYVQLLADFARENLRKTGYSNVTVVVGDGSQGLRRYAPYDRINVAAAAPGIPQPLMDQLGEGGRMVIPVGTYLQELYLVTKNQKVKIEKKCDVSFVPLKGKHGI
jgi:protein-L-isoaspartate(D-aspartate) O-methyltransferase